MADLDGSNQTLPEAGFFVTDPEVAPAAMGTKHMISEIRRTAVGNGRRKEDM